MLTRIFFGYYGGKSRFDYEIKLLTPPDCKLLVDCFGGSGVITINRPAWLKKAILNEKDPDIFLLHKLIADESTQMELIKRLSSVINSRENFVKALNHKKQGYKGLTELEKAEQVFILLTQSFNSCMNVFSDCKTEEQMEKRQLNYALRQKYCLKELIPCYKGVTVWNKDAFEVIRFFRNRSDVLLHIDCPYLWSTRGAGANKVYGHKGKFELKRHQHKRLLKLIKNARCKIILYGYWSELYENKLSHAKKNQWWQFVIKDVAKLAVNSENGQRKNRAFEYVWINFQPSEKAQREIVGLREDFYHLYG